jgi:hypothetical protein
MFVYKSGLRRVQGTKNKILSPRVLAAVLGVGGWLLEPFTEVMHPALGYGHGIVRYLFRLE